MSSGDFTREEAAQVISCLLHCAAIFGYRPTYRDFSGQINATIFRLTSFLIENLRDGVRDEALKFLRELNIIRAFRSHIIRKYGRGTANWMIYYLYRVIELTNKLPSEVEIDPCWDPNCIFVLKRYKEFLESR